MKRRTFLKSLGATAVMPAIPGISALASTGSAVSVAPAANAIGAATYKWAEVIARAHSSCSVAMLQRHLRLDVQTATALKAQLVKNGVISAQMNALGMNQAVKPLFDGAFIKPSNALEKAGEFAKDAVEQMLDQADEPADALESHQHDEEAVPTDANLPSDEVSQSNEKETLDNQPNDGAIQT